MAEAPAAQTPAASSTAPTPAVGSDRDVVHLKSGGFVRGVIEEYEPGGQVVLRKSDGSTRTFEGSEVDRVELGGTPSPKPQPAQAMADLEATPEVDDGLGRARVHIVRDDNRSGDLVLQQRTGGVFVSGYGGSASGVSWETVCSSPCRRPVDTSNAYFVNGLNKGPVLASKTFSLSGYENQDVTLRVRGGSTGLWIGGVLLLTAGSSAAAMSTLWFINDDYSKANGGLMLAAGTGALVAGIVMMVRGRHRVTIEPGKPAR